MRDQIANLKASNAQLKSELVAHMEDINQKAIDNSALDSKLEESEANLKSEMQKHKQAASMWKETENSLKLKASVSPSWFWLENSILLDCR